MANVVTVELDGHEYSVDLDDLTGRELGTIERLRRDFGGGSGTVVAVLLVAKQRAGEKVTEAELLDMKVSRWSDKTEAADPPTPPADGRPGPEPSPLSPEPSPAAA